MRKLPRRLFMLAPAALLAACAGASPTPSAPATDRPSFILFYAPG